MAIQKVITQLASIQSELKAPKSQFNKFGGYKYRKAEDILEAVKPLIKKYACALTCTDDLLQVGDRYYIKATATITSIEDGSTFSTTAYAREEIDKKGMDQSQVTGASSSYARKYALNGLLCIDDTADSDTTNVGDGQQSAGTQQKPSRAVKKADPAPAAAAPAEDPVAKAKALRAKWVRAIAEGIPTKSGKAPRQAFIDNYRPSEDDLANLDADVMQYRLEHNIPANSVNQ